MGSRGRVRGEWVVGLATPYVTITVSLSTAHLCARHYRAVRRPHSALAALKNDFFFLYGKKIASH